MFSQSLTLVCLLTYSYLHIPLNTRNLKNKNYVQISSLSGFPRHCTSWSSETRYLCLHDSPHHYPSPQPPLQRGPARESIFLGNCFCHWMCGSSLGVLFSVQTSAPIPLYVFICINKRTCMWTHVVANKTVYWGGWSTPEKRKRSFYICRLPLAKSIPKYDRLKYIAAITLYKKHIP